MTTGATCTAAAQQELTPVTNPEEVLAARQDLVGVQDQPPGFAVFE